MSIITTLRSMVSFPTGKMCSLGLSLIWISAFYTSQEPQMRCPKIQLQLQTSTTISNDKNNTYSFQVSNVHNSYHRQYSELQWGNRGFQATEHHCWFFQKVSIFGTKEFPSQPSRERTLQNHRNNGSSGLCHIPSRAGAEPRLQVWLVVGLMLLGSLPLLSEN